MIEFWIRKFTKRPFDFENKVSLPERFLYLRQKLGLKKIKKSNEMRLLMNGLLDPSGLGMFELMLYNSYVPMHYYFMFYELPLFVENSLKNQEDVICIDCGAHSGDVSDIFL